MSSEDPRDILVVVERHQGSVTGISMEVLGAARQLAEGTQGHVIAVVLGSAEISNTDALAAADRILHVNDPLLDDYRPGPWLAVLDHLLVVEHPRAVLLGSTSIGLDIGPLLAAKHRLPVIDNCRGLSVADDGSQTLEVTAGFYAGKLLADLSISRSPVVLLIAAGVFAPATQKGEPVVTCTASPVLLDPGAVVFHEMVQPDSTDIDISKQDILVAVGRGLQQEDNLEIVQRLADALGAVVAASRPVVDQGWLPATRQVGKSGMKVKPKCYLALGISGAPEHVEGMQESELTIAVNADPRAPIFEVADFGAVADMLDVAENLAELIEAG